MDLSELPPILSDEQLALIHDTFDSFKAHLAKTYFPGFGILPTGEANESFSGQLWTRDFAHATGNYFAHATPQAVTDSLETIFKYQKENGMLPYKVEREYGTIQILPYIRRLATPLFRFIEGVFYKRIERPLYEGEDNNGGEDTVPAIMIAVGVFLMTDAGKFGAKRYFPYLQKALRYFESKVDPEDGLAVIKKRNPDWTESVERKGKLGFVNVLWIESLYIMREISLGLGEVEAALEYELKFNKSKASLMEKLYDHEHSYFKAKEGEDRIDTAASIFGALFFLSPEKARHTEETLEFRVGAQSGLTNFAPKYPANNIHGIIRLSGVSGYHNLFVWPWVTCQNIRVKIKIAKDHPDQDLRERYKREAIADLNKMANLFKTAGGAYEIIKPDKPAAARSFFYRPPKNFMASMTAYQGAYLEIKALNWI